MNTTLTSRILAGSTVTGLLLIGAASGVFGTFSTTILSGNSCSGYGYFSGYGYGYECNPLVTSGGSGGGGGGGGAGSSASTSTTTTTTKTSTGTNVSTGTTTPKITRANPENLIIVVQPSEIISQDISRSPYRSAIQVLIQRGVINNSVKILPNRSITRAEFLKLLSIAYGYTEPVKVDKKFDDLPSTHSLYNYVNYGVHMGWVNVKNTNFRPDDIITQGEINKLINAVLGTANADTVVKPSYAVKRGKAMQDIYDAFFAQ